MGRNRKQAKKLQLKKETIRNFRPVLPEDLAGVAGGLGLTVITELGGGNNYTWRTRGCTPPP